MNASMLRGLAALCLLCVLPRLSALVVTNTTVHAFGASQYGQGSAGGGASILLWAPNDSLGTFLGVRVTAVVEAAGSSTEYNPYMPISSPPFYISPYPNGMNITPEIFATTYFRSPTGLVDETRTQHIKGPSSTLAYGQTAGIGASYQESFSAYLDPAMLQGTPTISAGTYIVGFGDYGSTSVSGNITYTTNYEYRVSEAGSTFALFAAGLILVEIGARRFSFKIGRHGG